MKTVGIKLLFAANVLLAFPFLNFAEEQPHQTLERALYYADLYNWAVAGPLFGRAEGQLRLSDPRRAIYAHIGALRRASGSMLKRSHEIGNLLINSPYLKEDTEMRLFALTVKGDLDAMIDVASAREDWTQVVVLSKKLGNSKWAYRAEAWLL
jgi:hypothetical protein